MSRKIHKEFPSYLLDHLDNGRGLVWSEDGGVKVTVIIIIILGNLAVFLGSLLEDKSNLSIKTTVLHNREGPTSVLALELFIL